MRLHPQDERFSACARNDGLKFVFVSVDPISVRADPISDLLEPCSVKPEEIGSADPGTRPC